MPEAMHKIMETLKPVDTEKCRQGKATIGDVDSQEYLRLITVQRDCVAVISIIDILYQDPVILSLSTFLL